ncbi:DNA polymerase III subunit gamma/tau, partial [bacterium]|nr:DNA polymerase III subunit gamma/tau [bacterium]
MSTRSTRFIVSALKHRPQTFAEVLAQDHVIRTLKHSLERGRIANAYIFSGSRGTGKTTSARIFAKALNCENRQDSEPCNVCDSCKAVMRGVHPDVIEIDAASNTSVDNIRDLREDARFSPSQSPYKIYIIDESHMLSKSANNAFLKTLEEPPAHCKFIFATTELHKIPNTILSRCQRYQFRRIPVAVIVEHLKSILKNQDEVQMPDDEELNRVLFHISRRAEGVLRDALVLLDQALAFCEGGLNAAETEEILGVIEFDRTDAFVCALFNNQAGEAFALIDQIADMGKDVRLFLSESLKHLRNLAVCKLTGADQDLLDLPVEFIKQLEETAERTSLEQILYITDMLWEAERRMAYSSDARLIMEMYALKAAKVGQAVKIDDLLSKIGNAPVALPQSMAPNPSADALLAPPVSQPAPAPSPEKKTPAAAPNDEVVP